jgi:hypothetical protein
MAESRQKKHHILLATDGKNIVLELFEAGLWPAQSSNDGQFRVRIDGKWYSPVGKYAFLHYAAVGALIARLLSGQEAFEEEAPPAVTKNQRVRVHYGECIRSIPLSSELGWTVAPPYRGIDGNWYVFVRTVGGTAAYPCCDVDVIKRAQHGHDR